MKIFTSMKFALAALFLALGTTAMADEITWTASEQGYANAQEVSEIQFDDNVSATLDKGTNGNGPKYYNTGTALRMYGSNSMTMTAVEGVQLLEVVFTFSSGEGTNEITVDNGTYANGAWSGSASAVTFTIGGTSGHRRIATITITYSKGGDVVVVTRPSITPASGTYTEAQTVTITAEEGLTIFYTLNGGDVQEYTGPFTVTESTVVVAYTQNAEGQKSGEVTSDIKIVDVSNLTGTGTADDPYDVASALKIITAGLAPKDAVFVKGVISRIGIEKDGDLTDLPGNEHGNATYFIKDDGGTDELEVYRGYGLGGVKFASADDIKVGDVVIVTGVVTLFGTTPEFSQGSQIYSLNGQLPKPETTYESIAAAKAAATAAEVLVTLKFDELLVTYINGANIYVTDGNEGFLLYGTTEAKVGDKISGQIDGKLYLYHALPELAITDASGLTIASSDNEVTPKSLEELSEVSSVSVAMPFTSMLVTIPDFYVEAETLTEQAVNLLQEGESVTLYDQFKLLNSVTFNTSKAYTATFIVSVRDDKVQLYPVSKAEWEEEYTFVGQGTQDDPYTVADAIHLFDPNQATGRVWVKGIIVGCANGSLAKCAFAAGDENIVNTNILIADVAGETTVGKCVPVNLPNETAYRTNLNLVDHVENIGKEVLLWGTVEKYFSVAGMKNLGEAIIDGVSVGIETVNTEAVRALGIYTLAGQRVENVTRGGLYIIGGKKVLVK